MNKVVEYTMVFKKIVIRTADGDFVGETPNNDGYVVIVLSDELLHLRDSIITACGHMS